MSFNARAVTTAERNRPPRFVEDKAGKRVHRFSLACPECSGWLPRFRASTLQQATEVTESAIAPRAFMPCEGSRCGASVGKVLSLHVVEGPDRIAGRALNRPLPKWCVTVTISVGRLPYARYSSDNQRDGQRGSSEASLTSLRYQRRTAPLLFCRAILEEPGFDLREQAGRNEAITEYARLSRNR
jgi:hypothetical protein